MKNLKSIADRKNLIRVLNALVRRKKIYIHTDGDIYTHKPASKRVGTSIPSGASSRVRVSNCIV